MVGIDGELCFFVVDRIDRRTVGVCSVDGDVDQYPTPIERVDFAVWL